MAEAHVARDRQARPGFGQAPLVEAVLLEQCCGLDAGGEQGVGQRLDEADREVAEANPGRAHSQRLTSCAPPPGLAWRMPCDEPSRLWPSSVTFHRRLWAKATAAPRAPLASRRSPTARRCQASALLRLFGARRTSPGTSSASKPGQGCCQRPLWFRAAGSPAVRRAVRPGWRRCPGTSCRCRSARPGVLPAYPAPAGARRDRC